MNNPLRQYIYKIGKAICSPSFLIKTAISIGLAMSAIIPSFIGIVLCGTIVGDLINPTEQHEHNYYACACDEPPILTEPQAITVEVVFFIALAIDLFFITRLLKFSKWEQLIALIILAIINYRACSIAIEILHTQVSG